MNKRERIALFQILILIIGIVAVSYAIGSEVRIVGAAEIKAPRPWDAGVQKAGGIDKMSNTVRPTSSSATIIGDVKKYENAIAASTTKYKESLDKFNTKVEYFKGEEVISNWAGDTSKLSEEGKKAFGKIETEKSKAVQVAKDAYLNDPNLVRDTGSTSGNWLLEKKWVDTAGTANFLGHIADGLSWSVAVVGVIQMIGGFIDDDDKAVTNALSAGAFGGIMAGKTAYGLIKEGSWFGGKEGLFAGGKEWISPSTVSIGAGILVAAIIFYMSYKKTETETVSFTCKTWDAPIGGSNCEKCNDGKLPCSEYQCRSLGQACNLVNAGTEESKCGELNSILEKLDNPNVKISFEELNFNDGEIVDFIYTIKDKETEETISFRCESSDEYDEMVDELKKEIDVEKDFDDSFGVFMVFEDSDEVVGVEWVVGERG